MGRYRVVSKHPILGHSTGETFEADLTAAERLLIGTHLEEVEEESGGSQKPDDEAAREVT